MEELIVDQSFLERIKKIRFNYEGRIPGGIHHYYRDILAGNNIEMYMQMYSLTKEELIEYARVCKILDIYQEISILIEMMKKESDLLEKEHIDEYQGIIGELQGEGETILDNIGNNEEDLVTNSNNTNLIIYSSFIDESMQKTLNSHSGKEEQTQKSIANIIEQLNKADYQSLRKKGYMHQIVEVGSNRPCYADGSAFERMGRGTTKLNFIRIPVSEKNREIIKKNFDMAFDTLYLVVSYGDFKNEGIDEKRYYSDVYSDFRKHITELLYIINLFKTNFTSETFPIAMQLINNGASMTEELTSIVKNRQASK